MRKTICIVTGSRAEYGLFYPLLKRLKKDANFRLEIIATGMHLAGICGFTYREIEKDGFKISDKVDLRLYNDSESGISRAVGLGVIKFAKVFKRLRPDILILLGDRYETFAAAVAAYIARIPIVHLYGGESTQGLIDEAIRHSITKMSILHFVAMEEYRKRVIQLGELPWRVFTVGALGIDNIKNFVLLKKRKLQEELGFKFDKKTVLVTFHPVTLEGNTSKEQFNELISALEYFKDIKVIFTRPNFDANNLAINRLIDQHVRKSCGKSMAVASLGRLRYLSALKYADVIVGNSSSGIIEAPSFQKPTVNIGDRQKGRIKPESVIDCLPNKKSIIKALKKAFSPTFIRKCKRIKNPYGSGRAAEKMVKILKEELPKIKNIKKSFYDIPIR